MPRPCLLARQLRSALFGLLAVPAFVAGVTVAAQAHHQSKSSQHFQSEQVQEIEQIVRDYLLAHPEILLDVSRELQRRQKVAQEQQRQAVIASLDEFVADNPYVPVLGNPEGDVTLVEFFDYRCPYCRASAAPLKEVIEADGGVRLIMMEYPILGEDSFVAARAALAAAAQGRYEEFHWALMQGRAKPDAQRVMAIAKDLGLDMERLEADMASPEVTQAIQKNRELGASAGITGTPSFVIGGEFVAGALDARALRAKIGQARQAPRPATN